MTLILFLFFAIAIFGIMFVLTIIKGITSFLFGKPNTFSGYGKTNYRNNNYTHRDTDNTDNTDNTGYKKVFSKEEGEYVKFEEINE